ncbi:MAG: acetyl-CoA carboxylase, carboxyltransferase subunit beta [Candidatus Sumerlaeia bacterium]
MAWFRKKQYTVLPSPKTRPEIPDGIWHRCESCFAIVYRKDFEANLKVCPRCNAHSRLSSRERIQTLCDPDSFVEHFAQISPTDPLQFEDTQKYSERLRTYQEKTGMNDAIVTGVARIGGHPVAFGAMEFAFMGGSMGSVLGEKVSRLMELALERRLPVVIVCASGGARMQEGILSLMQMAKTSIMCARLAEARLPYISILTHPTTAGVMASFATLADVILAEPDALIGFAGPRVIQQTINQILPKGFQKSEFVLKHGFVDKVVPRKDLKKTLTILLQHLMPSDLPDSPPGTVKTKKAAGAPKTRSRDQKQETNQDQEKESAAP